MLSRKSPFTCQKSRTFLLNSPPCGKVLVTLFLWEWIWLIPTWSQTFQSIRICQAIFQHLLCGCCCLVVNLCLNTLFLMAFKLMSVLILL